MHPNYPVGRAYIEESRPPSVLPVWQTDAGLILHAAVLQAYV